MKVKLLICLFGFMFFVMPVKSQDYKAKEIIVQRIKSDSINGIIKRIGKDSLINLLTQKIVLANRLIAKKSDLLHTEDPALIYYGYAKRFNIDTLNVIFPNLKLNNLFFKMYGQWFGNYQATADTIAMLKQSNLNTDEMFLGSMHQKYARYVFGFFCKELSFNSATIDSIYKFSAKLSDREQINLYYAFIEAGKSCSNDTIRHYQRKIEKLLEKNIRYTGHINDKALSVEALNLYYPLRYQAMRLYDRQLNLQNGGKEFVLLTQSQLPDGGWPDYLVDNASSEVVPTIYGLWSLLEWRDMLLKK